MTDYTVVNLDGNPVVTNAAGTYSIYNAIIEYTDIIFTGFFTVECFLKIISLGFFVSKYSYLRSWWNLLDFFVVVSGYAYFLMLYAHVHMTHAQYSVPSTQTQTHTQTDTDKHFYTLTLTYTHVHHTHTNTHTHPRTQTHTHTHTYTAY